MSSTDGRFLGCFLEWLTYVPVPPFPSRLHPHSSLFHPCTSSHSNAFDIRMYVSLRDFHWHLVYASRQSTRPKCTPSTSREPALIIVVLKLCNQSNASDTGRLNYLLHCVTNIDSLGQWRFHEIKRSRFHPLEAQNSWIPMHHLAICCSSTHRGFSARMAVARRV